MFDIGQNDLAGAFYKKTLDQVVGLIPTIIDIFQDGIKVSIYNISRWNKGQYLHNKSLISFLFFFVSCKFWFVF